LSPAENLNRRMCSFIRARLTSPRPTFRMFFLRSRRSFRGEEEVIVLLQHERFQPRGGEQPGELDGDFGLSRARFAGDGDRAPVVVDPFPQQIENGLAAAV